MDSDRAKKPPQDKPLNLPEPDPDNITVLTNKLPNEPILPWNRYDSPWTEEEEEEQETDKKKQTEPEQQTEGEQDAQPRADSDNIEAQEAEEKDESSVDKKTKKD